MELSYASYQGDDVLYNGSFSDNTDGTASTTYLLANVWYDFKAVGGTGIRPYVGGGVGGVMLQTDTTFGGNTFGYGDTDFGFAYQAGLGVLYPLGRGSLNIGYRLKGASGMDIDDNDGGGVYERANYLSHTLQVGYMINF
ncbi:acyloxyacyl hydrolase [Halovulum sp. GXIMD14793]